MAKCWTIRHRITWHPWQKAKVDPWISATNLRFDTWTGIIPDPQRVAPTTYTALSEASLLFYPWRRFPVLRRMNYSADSHWNHCKADFMQISVRNPCPNPQCEQGLSAHTPGMPHAQTLFSAIQGSYMPVLQSHKTLPTLSANHPGTCWQAKTKVF